MSIKIIGINHDMFISSAIINTSFNVNGEPIVCTPEDAIKTFFSCGLDYLVMGNYILQK